MSNLSIFDVVHDTIVDGTGFRTAIYAAGCTHLCPGCHNPQSWKIENGTVCSIESLLTIVKTNEFANVTFSGGDPLMQVEGFTELAKSIKNETNKNIWCYTGFKYEEIIESEKLSRILPYIDILVDGRYEEANKDEALRFRGSSNQRIIDVKKSAINNQIILWE